MHSLAMAQNILKAALAEAADHEGKRIESICVTIGDADYMEADSLLFCLEAEAKGTAVEGARIEIERVNANEMPADRSSLSVTLEIG
ncbi:hydrogenase/urease maturation nickel metallochaperone HypA [Chloroflexota bacterium]